MKVLFIAGVLMLDVVAVGAADLDAPVEKPVTLGSEIDRGHAAAVHLAPLARTPLDYEKLISNVSSQNTQNRTSTDGFLLGLHFGAWQNYWITLDCGAARDQVTLAALLGNASYQGFKALSARCELTKEQMVKLWGIYGYQPDRDDAAWEAAVLSKKFKGSKLGRLGDHRPPSNR